MIRCQFDTCTSIKLKLQTQSIYGGLAGGGGLPKWLTGKESTCQCRIPGFDSWLRKVPWSRKWQPTTVFLPEKSPGQRSLVGYSPWGHKELDTTEQLTLSPRDASSSKWSYWLKTNLKSKMELARLLPSPSASRVRQGLLTWGTEG